MGLANDQEDPSHMHSLRDTRAQSSGGEIFQHWWLRSTGCKSLGNFPVKLMDLIHLGPARRLWDSSSYSETRSSLGTDNWAKRKNTWVEFCCLCYTGDQAKLAPAHGTLYIYTDILCVIKNQQFPVVWEVFPIDKPNLLGFLLLWILLLLLKQLKYFTLCVQ